MKDKVKVLFVVSEFWQAGTQRFTFELDRALNKTEFEVDILCMLPLYKSGDFTDYYYPKHLDLGSKIHFFDEVNQLTIPTIGKKIKNRLFNASYVDERIKMKHFFDDFDCISIMGEYNFKEVYKYILKENKHKLLVHIQNSRYQVKNTYEAFPKEEKFHFVSGFHKGQIEFELADFDDYEHTYYNLNFKIENEFVKTTYQASTKPKIGIFTRLTPAKPLDPFLFSFQLVKEQLLEAEFHIFGSGDPVKDGVYSYAEQLKLENAIHFRGHQENILKTAVEEQLDLVWLHGYHGLPGGWVGFDMSTAKIPQLFWDFGSDASTQFHSFFPMCTTYKELATKSIQILSNSIEAKTLAEEQFTYTDENYNIAKNIHVMENLYHTICQTVDSEK